MKNNKVVYAWCENSVPFYIGIGSPKRPYSFNKYRRSQFTTNKRLKCEREKTFSIRILHCNLSWQEACELEISLISLYGRRDLGEGILTNQTDGGDGACGHVQSEEAKEKNRIAKLGNTWTQGSKNGRSKTVITPLGEFNTINEAADKYSVTRKTMRSWLSLANKTEFIYKDIPDRGITKGKINSQSKPVETPQGSFDSIQQASDQLGIYRKLLSEMIHNPNIPEYQFL